MDEVLTMSARMAAATGDLRWEERYKEFEPKLDAAIKEAMELAPEVFMSEAAAQTDEANIKLVAMEKQAFDLVGVGERRAASALLSSKEYERQKRIYSEGIEIITEALSDRTAAALRKQSRRALAAAASVVVAVPILLLAWMAALRATGRYIAERVQAEEALRESEDRYRTLVESSSTSIYVRQGDRFRFVNRRLMEVSGYSDKELLSMSIFDLVHPEDRELAQGQAAERDSGHRAEGSLQYRIVRKDGDVIWVETLGGVQVDYEGQPAVLSSFMEITDRKRAEESLVESEERYRSMVEAATDIIITIDLNTGVITSANAMAEETLGYKREDVLNKMHFRELIHPDEQDRALKNIQERVLEDKRYPNSPFRIRKSDGSYVHTEVNGAILLDNEGNPSTYLALVRDVTDRIKAEKALNEARDRLDSILEVAPIILWSVDADGIFLLSEGRGLESLGLKSGEVVGQSMFDLYKDYPELLSMIRRSLSGEDFMGDTEVGGRRWHSRYIPHRNEEGDVIGLFGMSMDITERTEAEKERQRFEAQLQHTQKLESLGILAGGIAHDFNNLLTGILGNADLALLNLAPASPARNNLGEIETAARRAAELCSQMLAYSGKGRFVVEAVSINELVEEMAHLVEISISKKAVLRYDFADNLPAIEADATQIRQIVMNLITNASEAIGEKSGVVSISTGAMECDSAYLTETYLDDQLDEGVYVYLEVSDSGCGMDAETREKIFDPFFTTKFTGRGLGLAAVLGIVRGHGGAIKIYSEPGKGTTFKALFPAIEGPVAASREADSQVEGWRGSGTVLLVDDEETVRTVGKLMLEEMGFSVVLSIDGREGVEMFRERMDEIVLVLLDMTMPSMSGEEAFREIKRIKTDVRIILSSGYNEQEVTSRFAGKGLASFVQKPYQYQTLVEKIRAVLAD